MIKILITILISAIISFGFYYGVGVVFTLTPTIKDWSVFGKILYFLLSTYSTKIIYNLLTYKE